jgi:hypothetical protein
MIAHWKLGRLLVSIDRFLGLRAHVVIVDSGSSDGGAELSRELKRRS